ncbi:SNF2 family protein, partial [gut metagenome]
MSNFIGSIMRFGENMNRHLSAFYTTRNPDFVASNFLRDMLYTNSMAWIKESPNYALHFNYNYGKYNPVKLNRLLSKYREGKLNMSDKTERLFY